jgi:dipeptidyl aminopeptidase/acylaminoacyl peptidase
MASGELKLLVRITGAALAACFFLACAGAQKSKKPSKAKFEIVFDNRFDSLEPKQRYQDMDVYVMNQYGEHVRRLTVDHVSHSPAWSPDGKQIVYLRDDQPLVDSKPGDWVLEMFYASMQRRRSLFRMEADGKNVSRIASLGPDVQGALWLPDDKHIGLRYSDRRDLRVYLSHGRDFNAPFDGMTTADGLLKESQSKGSQWQCPLLAEYFPPTTNYLPAFYAHRGNVGVVSMKQIYDLRSRMSFQADPVGFFGVTTLDGVPTKGPAQPYDAAWSPDGKRIAYSKFIDGKGSLLFVADLRDGIATHVHALTASLLEAHGPEWSTDGTRLAFTGLWKNSQQIFFINSDGSGLAQLSHDSEKTCSHPSWSPDGRLIVAACKPEIIYSTSPFFELGEWYSSIYSFNVDKPKATPRTLIDCGDDLDFRHSVDDRRCGAHNPSFAPAAVQ